MVNIATEQNFCDLLTLAMQLNGASELIIAKTLGYVEGIQDTRRQVERAHEQTDRERPEEKSETNPS